METIAIYWEPIIKTYGIEVRSGLSLVTIPLRMTRPDPGPLHYLEEIKNCGNLSVYFAAPSPDQSLRLHLLFEGSPPAPFSGADLPRGALVEAPVELIYLHGPHYGDRYGIADAAMGALAEVKVPLIAMACSSSSIHMVVADGDARHAATGLSRAFVVPGEGDMESGPQ